MYGARLERRERREVEAAALERGVARELLANFARLQGLVLDIWKQLPAREIDRSEAMALSLQSQMLAYQLRDDAAREASTKLVLVILRITQEPTLTLEERGSLRSTFVDSGVQVADMLGQITRR